MQKTDVQGFQLSPQQRRLWTSHQGSCHPSCVAQCEVRIRGPVDTAALQAVLQNLPARHEILRTTFYTSPEMALPLQVAPPVTDDGGFVEVHDLTNLSVTEHTRTIGACRERAARRRYDSADGRLAHLDLFRLSPVEHLLVIRVSSLLCDAKSLDNLVADIATCYETSIRGAAPPDDPLQYVDAAIWLNEVFASSEAAAGRQFWGSQDFSSVIKRRLPFELPAASETAFQPRSVPVGLPRAAAVTIRARVVESNASPQAFLLSCWHCLMQRLIGDSRLGVAYLSEGRSYSELENAIGLFARCLPLAGALPETRRFSEMVAAVAAKIRDAEQWGECFDWSLALPGDDRSTPPAVIPFVFEYRSWPGRHVAGDVTFDVERCGAVTDRFKLKLLCTATNGDIECALEYDPDFYREEDISLTAAQFEALLADALARPDAAPDELRVVTDADGVRFDEHARSVIAQAECVQELFEAQAARTPDQVAVICEEERLTYAELNARANQLAHVLQMRGVNADTPVAISLRRSADVVVGILGILKAGGAYVPLDPQLPKTRLHAMLTDSRATCLVTTAALLEDLPRPSDLVLLDADRALIESQPTTNLRTPARPENLVYILFTSGSTGGPKAVAVEHRNLTSYTRAVQSRLNLPAGANFATVTTPAADLGNTAIYPALIGGGCLHVITESRSSDPEALADYFARHEIDVLKIVPSHLKALLSIPHPHRILPRKRLVLGGEACPWDLVDEVRRLAPGCVVFNHYGPTETTVGATVYQVDDRRPHLAAATVPIGRALPHSTVYVLDRCQRPVPPWIPGELYIGGAGVARGYVNAPELTAHKFVPDPFSGSDGGRLYRTGDIVRRLPTGDLEFMGRIDREVKIRGFRVELEEIESALRRHPGIDEAAVLVQEDGAGEKRVVGFVVCGDGPRPASQDLRAYLSGELPDYMVPAWITALDALPLNPNGKLDRTALANMAAIGPRTSGEQPSTRWEQDVAEIWRGLLEVDEVSVNDNFYDLGGHSLMAMQVVTLLEKRTGVQIGPRDLLFHTLKQFAALCESKLSERRAIP